MSGTYSQIAEYVRANRAVAMATVLAGEHAGAKIIVPARGEPAGSIDPALDEQIIAVARAAIYGETSETRDFTLNGETVSVFIESFPPPQRLIIVGAVHIAIPLHQLAKIAGYNVTVVDPRRWLANEKRFPQADKIIVEWPDDALNALELDRGCSVVVLAHDSKYDQPALLTALRSEARYIGAIGSRTTNAERKAALLEQGISEEEFARIHAPVGLDLGAHTPAEIALSILAQIVANRYGRSGGSLKGR